MLAFASSFHSAVLCLLLLIISAPYTSAVCSLAILRKMKQSHCISLSPRTHTSIIGDCGPLSCSECSFHVQFCLVRPCPFQHQYRHRYLSCAQDVLLLHSVDHSHAGSVLQCSFGYINTHGAAADTDLMGSGVHVGLVMCMWDLVDLHGLFLCWQVC